MATPQTEGFSEEDFQKDWSRVILKPDLKERIMNAVRLFRLGDAAAPRGLLLIGPPGAGKTQTSRCIAESTKLPFLDLGYEVFKRRYAGQTGDSIQEAWENARARGRCVMRIDEIDYVLADRTGPHADQTTSEAVAAFVEAWEKAKRDGVSLLVVGEAFTSGAIDRAVLARFDMVVILPLPDASECREILRLELRRFECEIPIPDFVIPALGSVSGRDLANVAQQVLSKAGDCKAITPDVWQAVITEFTDPRS